MCQGTGKLFPTRGEKGRLPRQQQACLHSAATYKSKPCVLQTMAGPPDVRGSCRPASGGPASPCHAKAQHCSVDAAGRPTWGEEDLLPRKQQARLCSLPAGSHVKSQFLLNLLVLQQVVPYRRKASMKLGRLQPRLCHNGPPCTQPNPSALRGADGALLQADGCHCPRKY